MKYGSLFTGIGGFDTGFDRANMTCAWQVEQDPACLRVLQRHWESVPKLTDVRDVDVSTVEPVDLICGGFPCQDLSVAGKRNGLAGERSGLWFEFHRIVESLAPRWVVIENVPGLLSSDGGRDFAVILRGLVECGYGVCWRILDAQYFGVAQRRRRVFIVGSLGDGCSAEVLFERESLFGNPAEGREKRQGAAETSVRLAQTGSNGWGVKTDGTTGTLDGTGGDAHSGFKDENGLVSGTVSSKWAKGTGGPAGDEVQNLVAHTVRPGAAHWKADGADNLVSALCSSRRGVPSSEEVAGNQVIPVAFTERGRDGGANFEYQSDLAYALRDPQKGMNSRNAIINSSVRRLTPTECERLQGFPDGHTAGESDSARYRMLGNAVAVPCAEWIGRRIMEASVCPSAQGNN